VVAKRAVGFRADQLRRYALVGAEARLNQLRQEIDAIEKTFPELARTRPFSGNAGASQKRRRRRGGMSAAARKAVSERMRKYWAERRKAKSSK
jgi:hypothetical protein